MGSVRTLASLVKFEHTVFALPFAYAGMVLAAAELADGGPPGSAIDPPLVFWITVAMVGARTLAMALNRLVDAEIDARNPRTADRELPTGRVGPAQVRLLALASLGLLVLATWQLDPVTRLLWPIPVALFVVYPYTKRFTWLCHAVLGLSIGLAPLGAWLATGGGGASPTPWLLGLGIAAWIGGFDIIYATADADFDRSAGIRSIPARFGIAPALTAVRVGHLAAVCAFAAVGVTASLGWGFWCALAVAAGLLAWENAIIGPEDMSRMDQAFFAVNSWVGIVLGIGVFAGVYTT